MQICTSPQADNNASTPPLKFFTGWMPFLPPNHSMKALKAVWITIILLKFSWKGIPSSSSSWLLN